MAHPQSPNPANGLNSGVQSNIQADSFSHRNNNSISSENAAEAGKAKARFIPKKLWNTPLPLYWTSTVVRSLSSSSVEVGKQIYFVIRHLLLAARNEDGEMLAATEAIK